MKNSAVSFFRLFGSTAGGPAHKLSIISSVTISTAALFSSRKRGRTKEGFGVDYHIL